MELSYFIYNMGKTDFCITGIICVFVWCGRGYYCFACFAILCLHFQLHISRLPFFGTLVKVRKEIVALNANVQFFCNRNCNFLNLVKKLLKFIYLENSHI
jgi:hypothetical protein